MRWLKKYTYKKTYIIDDNSEHNGTITSHKTLRFYHKMLTCFQRDATQPIDAHEEVGTCNKRNKKITKSSLEIESLKCNAFNVFFLTLTPEPEKPI